MTVLLPSHMANMSTDATEAYTIDFREVAPLAAHEKMYVGRPEAAQFGGLAVGVPGELRGLKKAHDLWGTLPWADLVAPAVELAKGWTVQKELERRIEVRVQSRLCTRLLMASRAAHSGSRR
jgi:gamma-glutamyltranspeptidase / glutathione hydrolase / leukotriene-C4 hydrolase